MTDVDDPTNVGKKLGGETIGAGYHNAYGGIGQYTSSSNEANGIENTYWKRGVSGTTSMIMIMHDILITYILLIVVQLVLNYKLHKMPP